MTPEGKTIASVQKTRYPEETWVLPHLVGEVYEITFSFTDGAAMTIKAEGYESPILDVIVTGT